MPSVADYFSLNGMVSCAVQGRIATLIVYFQHRMYWLPLTEHIAVHALHWVRHSDIRSPDKDNQTKVLLCDCLSKLCFCRNGGTRMLSSLRLRVLRSMAFSWVPWSWLAPFQECLPVRTMC